MAKVISCSTENDILTNGGRVIKNSDGTISVYTLNATTGQLAPSFLTKPCCEALNIQNAYFDETTQKCRWTTSNAGACSYNIPFNVILNPKGNDGAVFSSVPDETCTLSVDFDYLFKFSGDTLNQVANGQANSDCAKVSDIFESLGAGMLISKVNSTQTGISLQDVYEETFFPIIGTGNLYAYLSGKSADTGFYVTCSASNGTIQEPLNLYDLTVNGHVLNCIPATNQLVQDIFVESGLPANQAGSATFKDNVSEYAFASNWLHYHTEITNPAIISGITNEKIKLSIKLSGVCVDLCVLVDNIRLDKKCSHVSKSSIFVTKSPGFELDRIRDNKKSWLANTEYTHRTFSITKPNGTQSIRNTDYYLNDERQVINSKEIDLDINIAAAVETDVWCYITDNPCILTGVTIGTTTCSKDVYFSGSTNIISNKTIVTGTSAVTTVTVVTAVTSSTVVTNTTTFTCPVGYSATPANDQCQRITTTPAVFNGAGNTILNGDALNVYGLYGTYFYPTVNTAVAPYSYNSSRNLVDANGTVIAPIAINNSSTFWASINSAANGRLNRVGLFAETITGTDPVTGDKLGWVGFSQCIDILSAGTYYVGLAADNYCRFKVNGTLIANFQNNDGINFYVWNVFPIYLNSGVNLIEMEGLNQTGNSSFGAEIYHPTGTTAFQTLTGATSTASTQANVIFSTVTKRGGNWDQGQNAGYSCPTGILNTCGTPICTTILNQAIKVGTSASSVTTTGYTFTSKSATTKVNLTGTSTTNVLSAVTGCYPKTYCCSEYCGDANCDLKSLLTQPLSDIKTVEDFEYYLTSELIDAKDRKTLSAYPTLRLLYDRYMNSLNYCTTNSSKFDYYKMNSFANLVGNYWVDLIEQVIPATTIWGSTRIYGNTMFDAQKFKYKAYSTFFGQKNIPSIKVLSPATGQTCNTDATTEVILGSSTGTTLFLNQGDKNSYSSVYLIQMNSGSEFIGNITILGPKSPCENENGSLNECLLKVKILDNINIDGTLKAIPIDPIGNVTYTWTHQYYTANTQSIQVLYSGVYTLTINDQCCEATAKYEVAGCNIGVTLNTTPITPGLNNGTITAVVTGQNGAISYQWNNGATTQTISNLSAGTYSVVVSDTAYLDCTASTSTTLYEIFTINTSSLSAITISQISATTYGYLIEWGDGNTSSYGTGTQSPSHVYSALNNAPIYIKSLDLSSIKEMEITSTITGTTTYPTTILTSELTKLDNLINGYFANKSLITGYASELPRTLDYLITTQNKLSGSTYDLPSGMTTTLEIDNNNYISGSTYGLPRNLKSLTVSGQNTISGATAGLPTGLTYMYITGNNTISGSTYGLPVNLNSMYIAGNNTINNSTYGLPNGLTYAVIYGQNTISGNTLGLPTSLGTLIITGQNIISGNTSGLPIGLTYLDLEGKNTLGGDVLNFPTGLATLYLTGSGTTSGDIANLPPNLVNCTITAFNTIDGDLANAPANVSNLFISGNNTITGYTAPRSWYSPMNQVTIVPNNPATRITDARIDNILFDLTGTTWSGGIKAIGLRGSGTAASNAAKIKLSGSTGSGNYGVTLTLYN